MTREVLVSIGAIYEKNLSTNFETSYCYASGQRIAMRTSSGLSFLVGDHLGSTSLTLAWGGTEVGRLKYYPFGETRSGYPTGSVPTDRRFTGQRQEDSGLGSLYDYGARFYSPAIARFISADTVVPGAGNPQNLNRYSYGLNTHATTRSSTLIQVDTVLVIRMTVITRALKVSHAGRRFDRFRGYIPT